jgi:hypothetical protein
MKHDCPRILTHLLTFPLFSLPSRPDKSSCVVIPTRAIVDYANPFLLILPVCPAQDDARPLNGESSHRNQGATGYGPFRLVSVWHFLHC